MAAVRGRSGGVSVLRRAESLGVRRVARVNEESSGVGCRGSEVRVSADAKDDIAVSAGGGSTSSSGRPWRKGICGRRLAGRSAVHFNLSKTYQIESKSVKLVLNVKHMSNLLQICQHIRIYTCSYIIGPNKQDIIWSNKQG